MRSYKICVYAIAKNEEKFAARWAQNMQEADEIWVLDTGSTDKTVEILKEYPKVRVVCEKIEPWRFDTARNRALALLPEDADLCVSVDLDEMFEPGWRNKAEEALKKGATQIRYRYTWNFLSDGKEGVVFYADKMHARHGFIWTHPVHEVLKFTGDGKNKSMIVGDIQLNHRADDKKSRSQYLPLLELSVREAPLDDRNMHYLAREYMFHGRYEDAIAAFYKHLNLKTATWRDERAASFRYIAACFIRLGKKEEAVSAFLRAAAEAPYLREPWVEFAAFCYEQKNYEAAIPLLKKALEITERTGTYMTDPQCWNEYPYDLLSMCYYYTGNKPAALKNVKKALTYAPENERLQNNKRFFA